MSEFEFPKSSPPRFALPDHEWIPAVWQNFKVEIRFAGEWRLVEKTKFVPTAAEAKQNLKRHAKERTQLPKKFSKDKQFADARIVSDVMWNLATLVQSGLAEKQAAKNPTSKLPKYLRKKPGATIKEIGDAAGLLHYLVSVGCKSLMEIAKTNPEVLRPIARKEMSWPLMMSKHPGYRVDYIQLLSALRQGADGFFDADQTSRDGTQRGPIEKGTREIAKKLYICLLSEWIQTGHKLDGIPVAEFCDDEKISTKWWKVAESRLLEAYPKPNEISELARIAAPSRKHPSDKNANIRRKLKKAFLGLAKNQGELAKLACDPVVKNTSNTLTP